MNNIKLFESAQIRSVWNEADGKWYFSVADVVQALTDSANVRDYIKKMRKRETELDANWGTLCPPLELLAPDGKRRQTQCANAEGLLRIIQSIPSPKAEPFKRWLARVGYERLEEIENPELAAKRMRELYKAKGYSDEWIEKRVRGIAIRDELTNEWQKRGVKEQREYAILTAEISRHLRHDSRRIQGVQESRPASRQSARPHERSGADLHHAGRGLHHRDRPQSRCAGL